MINKFKVNFRVTIKQLIISFLFAVFLIFFIVLFFGKSFKYACSMVSGIVDVAESRRSLDIKFNNVELKKRLSDYPSYGSVFASISIPSVRINLDVYHGASLDFLKRGAGHHESSYFPGEGGTVLITANSNSGFFKHLPEIKKNAEIIITASYGVFKYKVDSTDIVDVSKLSKSIKIGDKNESLILYTYYPIGAPGLKRDRFVVYASLVGE